MYFHYYIAEYHVALHEASNVTVQIRQLQIELGISSLKVSRLDAMQWGVEDTIPEMSTQILWDGDGSAMHPTKRHPRRVV